MSYGRLDAREFRYDGDGRQRYWSRALDPIELTDGTPELVPTGDPGIRSLWADYEGASPYRDSRLVGGEQQIQATRRYQPGELEEAFDESTGEPLGNRVLHGDLIGSAGARDRAAASR